MDEIKSYPTVREAQPIAEAKLRDEGWTPDPEGHPGHWVDPETGQLFAVTYHPAFPFDADRADEVGTVKLLSIRTADGDRHERFQGFRPFIDFTEEAS